MLTKDQLRQLLDELPDRPTRSGLEPYREFVIEMRRRKFSYRSISRLLTDRCGLEISHSAVHDFVKRHCPESRDTSPYPDNGGQQAPRITTTPTIESAHNCGRSEEPDAIRDRIAAMKRRPQIVAAEDQDFRFDPTRPLRLENE